jgi:hypothetical protein
MICSIGMVQSPGTAWKHIQKWNGGFSLSPQELQQAWGTGVTYGVQATEEYAYEVPNACVTFFISQANHNICLHNAISSEDLHYLIIDNENRDQYCVGIIRHNTILEFWNVKNAEVFLKKINLR